MAHKVLIALDDSENAMRAVEFVANSFSKDQEITLLSIVPNTAAICQMDSPTLIPHFREQQESFCAIEEQKKNLAHAALERGKEFLVKAGFDEKKTTSRLQPQKHSVAQDIIDEAHSGYQTIVMGRRGLSGLKEFVLGSVSQKVLHAAKGITVVIVE